MPSRGGFFLGGSPPVVIVFVFGISDTSKVVIRSSRIYSIASDSGHSNGSVTAEMTELWPAGIPQFSYYGVAIVNFDTTIALTSSRTVNLHKRFRGRLGPLFVLFVLFVLLSGTQQMTFYKFWNSSVGLKMRACLGSPNLGNAWQESLGYVPTADANYSSVV